MLADFPRRHTAFALVFCALMTPLGILIGMAATETVRGASGQLSKAVIISMSSGSFIFISLVELLPAGLSNGKHLLPKMAGPARAFDNSSISSISRRKLKKLRSCICKGLSNE